MYRPSQLIARQRRYFASIPDWPRDDRAVFAIIDLLATLELYDARPGWWMSETRSFDAVLIVTWWLPVAPLLGTAIALAVMWAYRFAKRALVWLIARSIPERRR